MARLVLIIPFLAIVIGCGQRPSQRILGKWEATSASSDPRQMEFMTDGSVVGYNDGSIAIAGKWKFLDDGRLRMEFSFLGIDMVVLNNVTFDGETMTMKTENDGNGKREKPGTYRRVGAFSPRP
jgi:hypothetical protein